MQTPLRCGHLSSAREIVLNDFGFRGERINENFDAILYVLMSPLLSNEETCFVFSLFSITQC